MRDSPHSEALMSPAAGLPATLTEDGFLDGRLRILQPEKGFRAGIDSVFLAASIPCGAGESVFEVGMGTGVAALCLLARQPTVHLTGIEIAGRYAMLAEENARRNGFAAHFRVIHADVKDALRKDAANMPAPGTFSHAMANPPYFEEGSVTSSPHILKAQAHAFGAEDLKLWVKLAHSVVVPRGTMTIIHRAESLGKLLAAMDGRFGELRVAPLYPRRGTPASRVIVQGVKDSKAPLRILPGLALHEEGTRFTPEAEDILRDGVAWSLR
jgi:tRNA1(Val) A37 N6-methylase TrmN6